MSAKSNIEWTEMTWNPVTGCLKISQGCKHCYAEKLAKRLHAMGSKRYVNLFKPTLHYDLIDRPKSWKSSRMIFVNSMSDLFQDAVPFDFIRAVFKTMEECPQHTFQILTKRSGRLKKIAHRLPWPDNIWMGVSVENDKVLHRIQDLSATPAKTKFLSCEPLIGPLVDLQLDGIHWVIVGGESGKGARQMKEEWVHDIRIRCEDHSIPFFFKQWGGVRKDKTGRVLSGTVYNEMPVRPSERVIPIYATASI